MGMDKIIQKVLLSVLTCRIQNGKVLPHPHFCQWHAQRLIHFSEGSSRFCLDIPPSAGWPPAGVARQSHTLPWDALRYLCRFSHGCTPDTSLGNACTPPPRPHASQSRFPGTLPGPGQGSFHKLGSWWHFLHIFCKGSYSVCICLLLHRIPCGEKRELLGKPSKQENDSHLVTKKLGLKTKDCCSCWPKWINQISWGSMVKNQVWKNKRDRYHPCEFGLFENSFNLYKL